MKIIVLGAGEVGFYLAKALSDEGHNVTVIDFSESAITRVSQGLDILSIQASCLDIDALKQAGIHRVDIVISVTHIDEVNLTASHLAKSYGVPMTIARIRQLQVYNKKQGFPYDLFGVDKVIHPEQSAAYDISKLSRTSKDIANIMNFGLGALQLIRLDVNQHSVMKGQRIVDIHQKLKKHFFILLIVRIGRNIIPDGNTVIQEGDQVYTMVTRDNYTELLTGLNYRQQRNRRVIIWGGTSIGFLTAQRLEKDFKSVKLIEPDDIRCNELSEALKKTSVIQGDATDINLLLSENIKHTDIFIATTDDDKNNLLSGLLARNNGAKKTICVLRRTDYLSLVPELGIDHVIAPRVSLTNDILAYVRSGKVMSVTTLADTGAEIVEQEITQPCHLTRSELQYIQFQRHLLIGGVIKPDGKVYLPAGTTQLEVGDRVIIIADRNLSHELKVLFQE